MVFLENLMTDLWQVGRMTEKQSVSTIVLIEKYWCNEFNPCHQNLNAEPVSNLICDYCYFIKEKFISLKC